MCEFPYPKKIAAVESLTPLWKGANFLEREVWDFSAFASSIIPICGASCSMTNFRVIRYARIIRSICASREFRSGQVDGTFVDERSRNKLLLLKQALGKKS